MIRLLQLRWNRRRLSPVLPSPGLASIHVSIPTFILTLIIAFSHAANAQTTPSPVPPTASCAGPPELEATIAATPSADAYADLGNWFGENNKLECAIEQFQAGVKLDPESPRLNYLLGLSLYTSGHLTEAVEPLQKSVQLRPEEDKSHLLLGSAFAGLGKNKEAFQEWEAALKIDPTSKMALDGLARLSTAAGDYASVIQHLSTVDRDESLDLDLAIAFGKSGMLDDAAQVLIDGLKKYPDSNELTRTLVTVYVKQLRYNEASKLAERLASHNPNDIDAQRIFLRILVLNGENETAEPLARKLLVLSPHDADFLYLNGVLERTAGNYDTARKHLEEAVALNPKHYNSRYNYGVVLEHLKDNAGAKLQLEKAIELGAIEPEIRFELAKVLRLLGNPEAAQEQLKVYQKLLKEKSDHTLSAQKSTQAAEALQAGDTAKAAALYHEALAAMPEDAGLAYRLAMVLNDLGDMEGERAALMQAIRIRPTFALAQYQLGYVNSRTGNATGAEQQFRLAVKADQNYVQAWVALAATLAMQARFPEAREAVATALKLEPENTDAMELSKNLAAGEKQQN